MEHFCQFLLILNYPLFTPHLSIFINKLVLFLQDDGIMFSCTAGLEGERNSLSAEGFGNRMCFLQSMASKV